MVRKDSAFVAPRLTAFCALPDPTGAVALTDRAGDPARPCFRQAVAVGVSVANRTDLSASKRSWRESSSTGCRDGRGPGPRSWVAGTVALLGSVGGASSGAWALRGFGERCPGKRAIRGGVWGGPGPPSGPRFPARAGLPAARRPGETLPDTRIPMRPDAPAAPPPPPWILLPPPPCQTSSPPPPPPPCQTSSIHQVLSGLYARAREGTGPCETVARR